MGVLSASVWGAFVLPSPRWRDDLGEVVAALGRVRTDPGRQIRVDAGEVAVIAGDPVFSDFGERRLVLVGRVAGRGDDLRIRLRPGTPDPGSDARLQAYSSDRSVAWVFRTLLPDHKREQVQSLARAAFEEHRAELTAALEPLVLQTVRDSLLAIQAELPAVLVAHRPQLQEIGVSYQDELVRDQLLPMAQARLLPLIVERSRPLLTEVGEEIWTRVSLWRVGSRYVWDRLPLTSGTSLEKEWQRVLDEEVVPVIEARVPEFVELTRAIVRAAAADPEIRGTVREAIGRVVEDPRVHSLAVSMFRQAVIDNQQLRDALAARWRSDEARAAFALTERRLQPTAVRIGEILFGVRGEGISPELAVVLRNRLLLKDRRWLVLEYGATAGAVPEVLTVEPGRDDVDPFQPGVPMEDGR